VLGWLGFKSDNSRYGPVQFSIILAKSGGSSRVISIGVLQAKCFFALFCVVIILVAIGSAYEIYHHYAIKDQIVQLEKTKTKIELVTLEQDQRQQQDHETIAAYQDQRQQKEHETIAAYQDLANRMKSLESKLQRIHRHDEVKISMKNHGVQETEALTGMGGAMTDLTGETLRDWLLHYGDRHLNRLQTKLDSAASIPSGYPVDMADAKITSHFGIRSNPFDNLGSEFHNGLDFAAQTGTKVYAAADGVVINASPMGGLGNAVKINHGHDYGTAYGHLSKILVQNGSTVKIGDLIGLVGSTGRSTGPHLHYIVYFKEQAIDPLPYV